MKSIYLTIAFVLSAFMLDAQSDQFVKVLVNKAQLEYLTTNIVALEEAVTVVEDAYRRADNNTIGTTKGDIIKIVHQSPSILSNICAMAQATAADPDAAGARHGVDYDAYAAKVNAEGTYEEIVLLREEVEILSKIVSGVKDRKYRLKETGYAIHESQKAKGSEDNLASLAQLTDDIAEAIEIIKIGQHR